MKDCRADILAQILLFVSGGSELSAFAMGPEPLRTPERSEVSALHGMDFQGDVLQLEAEHSEEAPLEAEHSEEAALFHAAADAERSGW